MPKVAKTIDAKIQQFLNEFGTDVFSRNANSLHCKICNKNISVKKKYSVTRHLGSVQHKKNISSSDDAASISLELQNESSFSSDLCKAFIDAGIPLFKIQNNSLRSFLEKYTNQNVPCESTLRKYYVDRHYNAKINEMRNALCDKKIWVSVDETVDPTGRQIANVIFGSMNDGDANKTYLVTCEALSATNSSTIMQLVNSALSILWPEGIKYEQVLLLVTDAAPYMKKAFKGLKIMLPKMTHVTCLAHALHRIAEEIRKQFPDVDSLISNVKKIFVKSPSRINLFKDIAPTICLPPEPILTRWGTWLKAALYYAANYQTVKDIVERLDPEEASSIEKAQELVKRPQVFSDLTYISTHFKCLPNSITAIEKRHILMCDALNIFEETISILMEAPGQKGKAIAIKCEKVKSANTGLLDLEKYRSILQGQGEESCPGMTPDDVACYANAPVTSTEVERSFSLLKNLLSDKRLCFKEENVKKFMVSCCNLT